MLVTKKLWNSVTEIGKRSISYLALNTSKIITFLECHNSQESQSTIAEMVSNFWVLFSIMLIYYYKLLPSASASLLKLEA